jgi:hypothetical protein
MIQENIKLKITSDCDLIKPPRLMLADVAVDRMYTPRSCLVVRRLCCYAYAVHGELPTPLCIYYGSIHAFLLEVSSTYPHLALIITPSVLTQSLQSLKMGSRRGHSLLGHISCTSFNRCRASSATAVGCLTGQIAAFVIQPDLPFDANKVATRTPLAPDSNTSSGIPVNCRPRHSDHIVLASLSRTE